MSATAFLFPGQGSQYVGMGKWLDALPAAAAIFDRAEAEGFPARELCFSSTADVLNDTATTQPALFTVDVATFEALGARGVVPDAVAGHSLGEHAALVAAGVVTFEEGLTIVRKRGELMAEAGKGRDAGMSAVLGLEVDVLEAICEEASHEDEVVTIANYNCPGQIVISGERRALSRAENMAKVAGARRVVPLNVSGAFHSPLMEEAAEELAEVIAETTFRTPRIAFYPNVSGERESDVARIRELVIEQVTHPVRWETTIRNMLLDGADRFVEVGPGNVLAGLNRRIARDISTWTTDSLEELEEVLDVFTDG